MSITTHTSRRGAAVGRSVLGDAASAGAQAVREALAGLPAGTTPALLVAFASSSFDPVVLHAGMSAEAGGVPLVGCTTSGEIAASGPGDGSVVVMALGGDISVATGMGEVIDGDVRSAAADAARCVDAVTDRGHTVLLLLSDGLSGDQQEVVRGAYQQVGATTPLVGGCAGDDLRMELTHQFFRDRVLTDAVVAVAISSPAPLGIGVRHGWQPVGEPMSITSAEGVIVKTIDDEPALDVYLRRFGAPSSLRDDAAAFTAYAATRPLGISRRGREEIRYVATADPESGSLHCFAEVTTGALGWIMQGDASSVLDATDAACADALAPLEGAAPSAMLVFDCIARKGVLGAELDDEVGRISANAEGAPVAGFYTYGEIARTSGSSGFHNHTLVVLALG